MRNRDEDLLTSAVESLKTTEPDSTQLSKSATRVALRLGLDAGHQNNSAVTSIDNCDDVRHLLASYRAGTLSPSRSLLVEAYLRDCRACHRQFKRQGAAVRVDWSTPRPIRSFVWPVRTIRWALIPALALLISAFFVYQAYWQVPPGVRAEVQSIDGSAFRVSPNGDRQLQPGDKLAEGEHLRTAGGAHAMLRLTDGSTVELNERSVLGVGARGHNMTVSLDNGSVIVQAAKRTSGHLYVKTPDCRVAVTGTVFSVSSGLKGSRVAVLQGAVQVAHSGVDSLLHAGDQLTTSDNLSPAPFEEQIAWSQNRDKYLPLLAAFATLQHRIGDIPFPQPRYSSDLLQRVPANTLLYVSIPNLGNFLTEANAIFHDQLNQSPELQQWWNRGQGHNSEQLDSLVNKLHDLSQYLGDEVVIVGVKQNANNPAFAVVADLQKSGLEDLLSKEFPASSSTGGLTTLNPQSLVELPDSTSVKSGGYALVRPHEVVFSNNVATLKQLNSQLDAGSSGFATAAFGQQITTAYSRGAGVIIAADLHQMLVDKSNSTHASKHAAVTAASSGMDTVQYLIAEHRELNGVPQNHLNVQFAGTRQRVASWLAAPAPIGSLDFVTPNAAITLAALSKDPKDIADDIMAMAAPDSNAEENWTKAQSQLNISVRDDIAANLSGDFLVALDGPVLPTPSWKAVIGVNNSQQLEQALETLTQSIRQRTQSQQSHVIAIEPSVVGAQRYYAVRDITSGNTVAQYTFSEGFMIIAPTRALLIQALQTKSSGDSLSRSAAFKALLPKDDNDDYSAVAYQNLSPVLTPLLTQLSGESADAIRKLAADSRPTAICAWGRDTRIEVASDSRLLGFDFLTLGRLLNSGNKSAHKVVTN